MFDSIVHFLNGAAASAAAHLVNTSAVTCIGVSIAYLFSRGKRWSAASRYSLWWLMLAFVFIAPFAAALSSARPARAKSTPATPAAAHRASPAENFAILVKVPQSTPVLRLSPAAILMICWWFATGWQLLVLMRAFHYSLRLKRNAEPAGADLQRLFHRLSTQACTRRPVKLSISRQLSVPAVAGYLQPEVLIPGDLASRLSRPELEQVLLHELAHVGRYDDWSIAAQRFVEALGVWHPLVRYLGYRLRRDREMVCDDLVAAVHEPKRYASCLAKVADITFCCPARTVLVPLLERKSELLARVEMLLDKTRTHAPRVSICRLSLVSLGVVLLGAAGLRTPKLMALPLPEPGQEKSGPNIQSIVVTLDNGQSSTFGNWSTHGEDETQPGSIEFKFDNKTFVIRDKGVLAQARQLLKPMEELGRRQSELGEQQSKLGDVQSQLGEEQGKAADQQLDAAASAKLSEELLQLKANLDELNTRKLQRTANDAQAQLAELQSQLAKMQAEMGSEQGKIGEAQGRLGERQAKLGSEQAELGKTQAEFGKRQEAESARAEAKLKKLIREAQERGLAQQLH